MPSTTRSHSTLPARRRLRSASPHARPPRRRHLRALPPLLRQRRARRGAMRPRRACGRAAHGRADVEGGATHVGVATDHVIESFRNELWPGYKTGEGMEPALLAQFHPLEEALGRWASPSGPWSSSRPTTPRLRGAPGVRRPARREGLHLDARQGPRAVRRRRPGRAGRPRAAARSATPRACARSSACRRAHPRLPRARRRRRGRLSRASPASGPRPPPGSSPATVRSGRFRPRARCGDPARALLFKRSRRSVTDAPLFADVEALRWRGPDTGVPANHGAHRGSEARSSRARPRKLRYAAGFVNSRRARAR